MILSATAFAQMILEGAWCHLFTHILRTLMSSNESKTRLRLQYEFVYRLYFLFIVSSASVTINVTSLVEANIFGFFGLLFPFNYL